ncbi:hypothetical protein QEN19_000877 [Hanseniaspora menglaensis]
MNNENEKNFLSINVGIDERKLWYVNASLTGQEQKLRLDIAQPYIWVVDAAANEDFYGSTYEVNTSNVVEFDNVGILNMSFVDNIQLNCSAYTTNMNLDYISSEQNNGTKSPINQFMVDTVGFFAAYDSQSLIGSFGLAGSIIDLDWQESQIDSFFYNDSFVALKAIKEAGEITNAGYSLWLAGDIGKEEELASLESSSQEYKFSNYSVGSLMLNYVNSSLFTGDLIKFSSIPYYDIFSEGQGYASPGYPIFPLTGAKIIFNSSSVAILKTSTVATAVLLDSRYSISYLPIDIIQHIAEQTNAFYATNSGSWYVDCEIGSMNTKIEFVFGQLSIKVPLKEFLTEAFASFGVGSSVPLYFNNKIGKKTAACVLKIQPNYLSGINILGAPFLKYSYLAADLETSEFALAQAAIINENIASNLTATKNNYIIQNDENDSEKKQNWDSAMIIKANEINQNSSFLTSNLDISLKTTAFSAPTASFISSGYIPFAKPSNLSETDIILTPFSAASTQSTQYDFSKLGLFGHNFTCGSINSDGEILTTLTISNNSNTNLASSIEFSLSNSYKPFNSESKLTADINSIITVITHYTTEGTEIFSGSTSYKTSEVLATSFAKSNETSANYKNSSNDAFKYTKSNSIIFLLTQAVGISIVMWLLL